MEQSEVNLLAVTSHRDGTEAKPRLPGIQGVWVFVILDMSFFGMLFISYVLSQSHSIAIFADSQRMLDTQLGLINTLILLTSSWLVALSVQALRTNALKSATRLLGLGVLCGSGFILVKAIEYHREFSAGVSLLTNDFFMFYFVITFIHLIHVIIGLTALTVILKNMRHANSAPNNSRWLESAATFWHAVDLLWVVIFSLLYLVSWQ